MAKRKYKKTLHELARRINRAYDTNNGPYFNRLRAEAEERGKRLVSVNGVLVLRKRNYPIPSDLKKK